MTRWSAAIQFLALATIVLTQTLGACCCIAAETVCSQITFAIESPNTETQRSDCCSDESEREESPSCCLELGFDWDIVPVDSGIILIERSASRSNDSNFAVGWDDSQRSGSSPGFLISTEPRPPSRPVRALFGVRLI